MVVRRNISRRRGRVLGLTKIEKVLRDNLKAGITIIDDEMRILWFNDLYADWFGKAGHINASCSFIHEQNNLPCENCPAERTFASGQVMFAELYATNFAGEKKLYRFTTIPLLDKLGVVFQVMEIIEDLTANQNVIESLLSIFCLDQQGKIVSTNPEHLRLADANQEQVLGLNWIEIPKSRELGLSKHLQQGLNGEPFELNDFRYLTYRGDREIFMNVKGVPLPRIDGKIGGLLCIAQDTTERVKQEEKVSPIIGTSKEIKDVLMFIEKVAPYTCTVLIEGESGTGKELVAQEVHRHSNRSLRPFVAVNGAAFQDNLLESELFGHEKGAFTGAESAKTGLFEIAHGGTLFIDEIGDISKAMQAKLLRVLETGIFRPVGSIREIQVDVRILVATNCNLEQEVEKGTFREDLYYRLNVIKIDLPPLRERKNDIPLLANHFINQKIQNINQKKNFIKEAMEVLLSHDWPGNVRELAHVVERALIFSEDNLIQEQDLAVSRRLSKVGNKSIVSKKLSDVLAEVEKEYLALILAESGGDKQLAAQILGISWRSLYRKIKEYGIED